MREYWMAEWRDVNGKAGCQFCETADEASDLQRRLLAVGLRASVWQL